MITLLDQCLAAYAPAEWARLETQLASLPAFSRSVKTLARLLTSRAAVCDLDGQGRVLLPPSLRAAASLGREAVVVGVLNRIEIWAPVAWDAFLRDSERMLDDVSLDVQWPPPPAPLPAPPATPVPSAPDSTRRPQAKPYR